MMYYFNLYIYKNTIVYITITDMVYNNFSDIQRQALL